MEVQEKKKSTKSELGSSEESEEEDKTQKGTKPELGSSENLPSYGSCYRSSGFRLHR